MEEVEKGTVRAFDDHIVEIALESSGEECHGCGMHALCTGGEGQRILRLPRDEIHFNLHRGQPIELRFKRLLAVSFIIYLLPLFFFLAGLVVSGVIFHIQNELIMFIAGMGGLAIGLGAVRILNNYFRKKGYAVQIQPLKQ